ncbi:hypothetical protein H5U35_03355, partial [Candidatus Aerophobetes bacterium]|nr:hypothetical protein [Candidatus Aerophobetes bacterium]
MMMDINQKFTSKLSLLPRPKLIGRVKMGQFFSFPEEEFSLYIKKIEDDPLFREVFQKYKLVSYRKFKDVVKPPTTRMKEEALQADFSIEELVQNQEEFKLVQKIALKMGKKFFLEVLSGKKTCSPEVFERYGFSESERKKFLVFVNKFQLQKIFFYSPPILSLYSPQKVVKVAMIEKEKDKLSIVPLGSSEYLGKGRYIINY